MDGYLVELKKKSLLPYSFHMSGKGFGSSTLRLSRLILQAFGHRTHQSAAKRHGEDNPCPSPNCQHNKSGKK